jgi:hypothetical protein
MAKGRQPGVLVFGFKGFLEGVVRQKESIPFDKDPSEAQKKRIDAAVSDLREAMKLEKSSRIDIKDDKAPHTKEVVELFLKQLRETMTDTVETNTSLREQLIAERMARESLMKRLQEVEEQLERSTKGRKPESVR